MEKKDNPKTPREVDKVVCAEIPCPEKNRKLYDIITKTNIHGPCGSINPACSCMENGYCTKEFPKPFSSQTKLPEDSYPVYRRRSPEQGGRSFTMKINGNEFVVDNRWVVPFNPYLTLKYNCHINIEVIHSVLSVKYLYKYVHKGSSRVMMKLSDGTEKDITNDEVTRYQNARYISASEAAWRIYDLPIIEKYPSVVRLSLHLPGEQTIFFQEGEEEVAVQRDTVTMLTDYFALNAREEAARDLLYPDLPQRYVWNSSKKQWQLRVRNLCRNPSGERLSDSVGRLPVITLSPHQSELYYLRLLLHHRSGATSFDDLKTLDGETLPTFQAACLKLGLLEDDNEVYKVKFTFLFLDFASLYILGKTL